MKYTNTCYYCRKKDEEPKVWVQDPKKSRLLLHFGCLKKILSEIEEGANLE